jgi:apolipoprotein N-acyltransferase
VQARLPDHVADVLDVSVQGTTGLTPFVRVGNLAALLTALVLFAGVALGSASGMRTRPA